MIDRSVLWTFLLTLPQCVLFLQRSWLQIWPGVGSPRCLHPGPSSCSISRSDQEMRVLLGRWLLPHPTLASHPVGTFSVDLYFCLNPYNDGCVLKRTWAPVAWSCWKLA